MNVLEILACLRNLLLNDLRSFLCALPTAIDNAYDTFLATFDYFFAPTGGKPKPRAPDTLAESVPVPDDNQQETMTTAFAKVTLPGVDGDELTRVVAPLAGETSATDATDDEVPILVDVDDWDESSPREPGVALHVPSVWNIKWRDNNVFASLRANSETTSEASSGLASQLVSPNPSWNEAPLTRDEDHVMVTEPLGALHTAIIKYEPLMPLWPSLILSSQAEAAAIAAIAATEVVICDEPSPGEDSTVEESDAGAKVEVAAHEAIHIHTVKYEEPEPSCGEKVPPVIPEEEEIRAALSVSYEISSTLELPIPSPPLSSSSSVSCNSASLSSAVSASSYLELTRKISPKTTTGEVSFFQLALRKLQEEREARRKMREAAAVWPMPAPTSSTSDHDELRLQKVNKLRQQTTSFELRIGKPLTVFRPPATRPSVSKYTHSRTSSSSTLSTDEEAEALE